MLKKKLVLLSVFLICLGLGLYFVYAYSSGLNKRRLILEKRKAAWLVLKKTLEARMLNFPGDTAIVIEDLNTGWKIALNEDKLFPAASVVKIPIMAACFYAAYKGKISLKDELVLKASFRALGSGVLKNAAVGSRYSVARLIELMITESDNTAANMLIELLGFDYLNGYFKSAGFIHTNLARKMMDFKYRKKGVENYTTASDVAFILERIYRREFLNKKISARCLSLLLHQKVNDRIPKKLPAQALVAHKTGLERNICHDAGIVFMPGEGRFLICILTQSKAGARQAKAFISNISLYIYNNYQRLPESLK